MVGHIWSWFGQHTKVRQESSPSCALALVHVLLSMYPDLEEEHGLKTPPYCGGLTDAPLRDNRVVPSVRNDPDITIVPTCVGLVVH
jgi:hypothetical protein